MLGVRVDLFRNDEMIEETDFHQREGFLQATGDHVIRRTRVGNSAWMLGFISRCNHHLFASAWRLQCRILK